MTNLNYNLLKELQKQTETALLKELETRHIFTGHSLIMRSIKDIRTDMNTRINRDIERITEVVKYYR